jgi:SAM-dependent methyltransferase
MTATPRLGVGTLRPAQAGGGARADAITDAELLWLHQRERLLLGGLRRSGLGALQELEILDVGCGAGGHLVRLLGHGADAQRLHGVDLSEPRVALARRRLPAADLQVVDGRHLPYPAGAMDVVLQFTTLSSIVAPADRAAVAREMARVTRPGGLIVSYDFWLNPFNSRTRGVTRRELRALFPGARVAAHSVTLAPPIARPVCRRSYTAAALLQALPPLRTHVLAFIRPAGGGPAP